MASQTVSVLISIWVLSRRKLPFAFGLRDIFRPDWHLLGRIVRFGTPIAWLMSVKVGTLFSIGLSVPLSTLSQIIMCFIFFAILKKKEQTHPAAP